LAPDAEKMAAQKYELESSHLPKINERRKTQRTTQSDEQPNNRKKDIMMAVCLY
jgi:hypothetical protein